MPKTPTNQRTEAVDPKFTPLSGSESYSGSEIESDDAKVRRGRVAHGVLSNGHHFAVPETESVLAALLSLRAWCTPFNWLWMGTVLMTAMTLYFNLSPTFYFVQAIFWRLMYNIGLGLILRKQSNTRWWEGITKKYVFSSPAFTRLVEKCVLFIDTSIPAFKVKDYPHEFSSWMVYRLVVKIILANDVAAYYVVVFYNFYWPTVDGTFGAESQWSLFTVGRYVLCAALTIFALWSKSDAHRVLGDYAWYWGDFWFLLEKDLVFDGIFQMFPHPMYTVGYSFMYGSAIAARGYTVLYVSVLSHLAQMFFLAFVENPHIDKTYNTITAPTDEEIARDRLLYGPASPKSPTDKNTNEKNFQQYELPYFERKELIALKNFDIRRGPDMVLLALIVYSTTTGLFVGRFNKDTTDLSGFGPVSGGLLWCVIQCVVWRLFFTVVLGTALRQQSTSNAWVEHFKGNTKLAFSSWKVIYNTTVTMMNLSYLVVFLRCCVQYAYAAAPEQPDSVMALVSSVLPEIGETSWAISVVGVLLVLVNVYVSDSVFDAIGPFGYFYADFFIKDVPAGTLSYSGIYRYLNNPDSNLGFAGYYGLALIAPRSTWYVMFPLALFCHLCGKVFERWVEAPHMQRKYGKDALRKEGGLKSELKRRARDMRAGADVRLRKLRDEIEEKTELYEKIKATMSPKKKPSRAPGKKGEKAE